MSRLVTVARFWDAPEMAAAVGALRAAGFHPQNCEFFHATVFPILFVGLGGARVQVPEEEAAEAVELIRKCREGTGADDHADAIREAAKSDGLLCPRCGSDNYFRLKSWILAAAFYLTWGVYAPLTTGRLLCRKCGHRWRDREAAA